MRSNFCACALGACPLTCHDKEFTKLRRHRYNSAFRSNRDNRVFEFGPLTLTGVRFRTPDLHMIVFSYRSDGAAEQFQSTRASGSAFMNLRRTIRVGRMSSEFNSGQLIQPGNPCREMHACTFTP